MVSDISLGTTLAGSVKLKTCVYNASGPRTGSSAALAKVAASQVSSLPPARFVVYPLLDEILPKNVKNGSKP